MSFERQVRACLPALILMVLDHTRPSASLTKLRGFVAFSGFVVRERVSRREMTKPATRSRVERTWLRS